MKKKIIKTSSTQKDTTTFPEHVSIVPFNEEIEAKKGEARKRANKLREESGNIEAVIVTLNGETKLATELTIQEQETEIIRCASSPEYLIETYFTIFDQMQGDGGKIVPFKLFQIQNDLIKDYQKYRFNVANKYRQAGISTTTSAYIAWYLMFDENKQVAIIADKLETARDEMMRDVVDFIDSCPDYIRIFPTKKDTQKHKHYDNNCQLRAFASSMLRGYTPTLLFWDETAWAERGEQFWTAARPSLQTGGRAIFVSCVTKDTFVFTNKGIKQIKDFIKTEELGGHFIDEYSVLGIHKTRKGNILFNNGYVDTYKIKTTYSELESSKNHKYWAYKNGKYGWMGASELEVNDYISIQKGMNIWGNNDNCFDFKPTESNRIKNIFKPNKITKDIAYLIGLYISEGCGVKRKNKIHNYYGITITCGDDISYVLKKIGLIYYKKDELHYEISSLHVSQFFEYLGFDLSKKAPQKIIPSRLLEMSRNNIIAMMQGIMDGDGWATYGSKRNRIRIGIGLSSLELIKQIRIIFNNFGILTEFQQVTTPVTKLVKVESIQYRLTANGSYAKKYFKKIGFRLGRKKIIINDYDISKLGHIGVCDNIPNGIEIINEIYNDIKYYGVHIYLNEYNINVKDIVQKKLKTIKPSSRKTILNLIKNQKENITQEILDKYYYILNENIVWTKIKSIEKSKNWTYDFSLSNENEIEWNEHHVSLIYNGLITHNTPNGLDPVFYKHFEGAKRGTNNFHAIELWWYNDPRYVIYKEEYGYDSNKKEGDFDLEWVKNKGHSNEIRVADEHWSHEKRQQMVDDKWEATSSWFEFQVRDYDGDTKKLAQELLCVFGDTKIIVKDKNTSESFKIKIEDFYKKLEKENNCHNTKYEILNSENQFVDFIGINKKTKKNGLHITLENGYNIKCSENHIFLVNDMNVFANSLSPNISYLSTISGDYLVSSIKKLKGNFTMYDIVEANMGYSYVTNNIISHNCSFLGSGDNFIDEAYIKRIEEHEIRPPIRQEYLDNNMWIWEDPIPNTEYIIAVDVSAGHGEDNSTVNILKIEEHVEEKKIVKGDKIKIKKIKKHVAIQVAEYYGKLTPNNLGHIVYEYGVRYNNGYVVIDVTNGYGAITIEVVMESGYKNIHYAQILHKPTRDRLNGYVKVSQKTAADGSLIKIDLIPGFFIGNNRASVLIEFQRTVNMKDVIIRSFRLLNEIKTFVTVSGNRVADHKRSFHDDSIIGISIGIYTLNHNLFNIKDSISKTKKMLDAIIKVGAGEEVEEVEKRHKDAEERHKKDNLNTRTPDFRVSKQSPYGANSWLFDKLNKRGQ